MSKALERNMEAENKLAMDVFAWFMNVSTSVLIVFINKILMDPNWGYKFVFATTLCSFHFLACGASVWAMEAMGIGKRASMPWGDLVMFAIVASVSIASLNLSLLVNSVGFYQISKLLIIPFVCAIEAVWLKRRFTLATVASILVVVAGVAIVTVTDVNVSLLGLIIAAISVVTSGMQQILCGTIQRKHSLTSNQLLSNTAPLQGVMLLFVGPWVDLQLSKKWILGFEWHTQAIYCLTASCAVAVLVNISQFMCLGRFSAVTFQVLGHTKTVLVLICGWLYLGDTITQRKLAGMILAVVGMVLYGYFNSLPQAIRAVSVPVVVASKGSKEHDEAKQPLLVDAAAIVAEDAENGAGIAARHPGAASSGGAAPVAAAGLGQGEGRDASLAQRRAP